jgi:hypothetical protein
MTKSAGQIRHEVERREAQLSLLDDLQVSSSESKDDQNGETGENEKKS